MANQATLLDLMGSTPVVSAPAWKDTVEAFDVILQRNVDGPNRQFSELRFLKDRFDIEVLQKTCRLLGFDITQDVLDLQVDLTKLVTQLPMYADYNGTYQFEKFIQLVLNGECEIEHLYAKIFSDDPDNYYDFTTLEPERSSMVTRGGDWVKTTHIDLKIGILFGSPSLDSIVLNPGQSLYQRVIEIFYDHAPIALVIRKFMFIGKLLGTLRVGAHLEDNNLNQIYTIRSLPSASDNQQAYYVSQSHIDYATSLGDFIHVNPSYLNVLFDGVVTSCVEDALSTSETIGMVKKKKFNTPAGFIYDAGSSWERITKVDGSFTIYFNMRLKVLSLYQHPVIVSLLACVNFSSNGIQNNTIAMFLDKSQLTTFANLRAKPNGPIFSSYSP